MRAIRRIQGRLRVPAACAVLLVVVGVNGALAADKPRAYEADAGFDVAPQSLSWYSAAIVARQPHPP